MVSPVLQVGEYAGMAAQLEGAQAIFVPPLVEQVVSAAGGSVQSAPFSANTRMLRIHAKVSLCVAFGQNPTATTANFSMAAGQTEYVRVNPGDMLAVTADP